MKKKQTKQKIKEISIKVINIIGYVCIGLVLVLGILTGVNSCKNKQDQSAKTIKRNDINEVLDNSLINASQFDYYYLNGFDINNNLNNSPTYYTIGFSADTQNAIYQYFDSDSSILVPVLQTGSVNFDIALNGLYVINEYNDFIPIDKIQISFITYGNGSGVKYYYRFSSLRLYKSGSYTRPIINQASQSSGYDTYNNYRVYGLESGFNSYRIYRQILCVNKGITLPSVLTDYFYSSAHSSSTFDISTFNPNAPYQDYAYNSTIVIDGENGNNDVHLVKKYFLRGTWFISNGQLFNCITFNYSLMEPGSPYQNEDGIWLPTPMAVGVYWFNGLYYENLNTQTQVIVCERNIGLVSSLNGETLNPARSGPTNVITWRNYAYRTITLLNLTNQDYNGGSSQLLAINNGNESGGSNPFNPGSTFGDYETIFDFIGLSWVGIYPLVNIEVLPGITIGLLLAVPIVAGLIFVIIKVIKK